MPFTIGGDWVPNKPEEEPPKQPKKQRPVKVRLQKRGRVVVTVILNLNKSPSELKELAAELKRECGSGGTVKDGVIEIQGDHVKKVEESLRRRKNKKKG